MTAARQHFLTGAFLIRTLFLKREKLVDEKEEVTLKTRKQRRGLMLF